MKRLLILLAVLAFCAIAVLIWLRRNIDREEAIRISQNVLAERSRDTIREDIPPTVIEKQLEKGSPYTVISEQGVRNIEGKRVWAVTYYTTMDIIAGPMVLYIDYYSGEFYGFDLRF